MIQRCKIKHHTFRQLTGSNPELKKGLYFYNRFDKIEKNDLITESEILRITEWLNRYCNQYIHKKTTSFEYTRSQARAVVKSIELLESQI